MPTPTYDIITVGGGLGGASLAKAMAEHGAKVLVLERETQFKDRVRGEQMACWGVAEAKRVGIYDALRSKLQQSRQGKEIRWWQTDFGVGPASRRDCISTTQHQTPQFCFYHPAMQEVLLTAAAQGGAEVWRGARVVAVQPGAAPRVTVERNGQVTECQARLIVGADGRASLMRKWANFPVRHDPPRRRLAGIWFAEMPAVAPDLIHWIVNMQVGQAVLIAPQDNGQVRAYLVYPHDAPFRIQGEGDLGRFVEESVRAGAPAEWYAGARADGPLASFEGADTWVEHSYKEGIALIGDAASSNDPSFGQGLSLTLRDVRILRDHLLAHTDWDVAGHAYAEAHDLSYGAIHRSTSWFGQMFYDYGPEADARRAKALPLIAQDPSRMPDHIFSGPDLPADERARRRFFGEE